MNCLHRDFKSVRSEEIGFDGFVIETSRDKLTPGVSRDAAGLDLVLAGQIQTGNEKPGSRITWTQNCSQQKGVLLSTAPSGAQRVMQGTEGWTGWL